MTKIDKELLNSAKNKPDEKFKIMIVLSDEKAVKNLPIKNFKIYMGNILSATVTGDEISKLINLESVESIEIDGEVRTM